MSKAAISLIAISILFNSSASLLLKKGASALTSGSLRASAETSGSIWRTVGPVVNIYTILGLFFLVISFGMFLVILSKISVSVAQPILALSYILVAIGAFFFYHEPLTAWKIVGILVIIGGVTILSQSPA